MQNFNDHPIAVPLDLKDEHRTRYETVVILRRFIDPSGRQPIRISKTGTVRKGKLAMYQTRFDPDKYDEAEQRQRDRRNAATEKINK